MTDKTAEKYVMIERSFDGTSSTYEVEAEKHNRNDVRIKLKFAADDPEWTDSVRGKTAVKLKDNGNGVKITFRNWLPDIRKVIFLDYSELVELKMLIEAYERIEESPTVITAYSRKED